MTQNFKRYKYLENIIEERKIKNIIEVGVYRCKSSINMLKSALINSNSKDINYFGFDLFDSCPSHEFSKSRSAYDINKCYSILNKFNCNIKLIKGDTNITLPNFVKNIENEIELIFIDGGHSFKTIKNDWENLKTIMTKNTICIFDDYYKNTETVEPGCNYIIDSLDRTEYSVEFLPDYDSFETKDIYFVKVQKL
jgi:hypothetical protein